jgi:hypothetical protein
VSSDEDEFYDRSRTLKGKHTKQKLAKQKTPQVQALRRRGGCGVSDAARNVTRGAQRKPGTRRTA